MELTVIEKKLAHIPNHREVGGLLCRFIDTVATATARGSFYNTKEELQRAVEEVHAAVFSIDRGLYTVLLAFPSVMDYSRQIGVARLLSNPRDSKLAFLDAVQEKRGIHYLAHELPIQRRLKMFEMLANRRVNNARTRKLILRSILNDPKLTWHALKYRGKLKRALVHAWGVKTASTVKVVLKNVRAKENAYGRASPVERAILTKNILAQGYFNFNQDVADAILFILGSKEVEGASFKAYYDSNHDFDALALLPPEVAEGKRSTYHPDRTPADVLELTKDKLTSGQQMTVQRSAKEKGVKVDFDPRKYDAVKLYIYAHEMGMTPEIKAALHTRAIEGARALPASFGKAVIVLDMSKSMLGHKTQKYRPMAIGLALSDLIRAASDSFYMLSDIYPVVEEEPRGHTALAKMLLDAVRDEGADHVFIITDGYENAPAGRVDEVVAGLRKIGNMTPITQITPVMASEVFGTRALSPAVPVLPVTSPAAFGLALVKNLLETDLVAGVKALMNVVSPKMLGGV